MESSSAPVPGGQPSSGDPDQWQQLLENALKFVFSWIVLAPIAIIVAGKLATQVVRLPGQRGQLFQIKIPALITMRASGQEVTLGFAVFILCLACTGFFAGKGVYHVFVDGFGIDPGQFNVLCVFSAFLSVALTSFLLVVVRVAGHLRGRSESAAKREYEAKIEELGQRGSLDRQPGSGGERR
ncbi:hypothetical protein [Umezawaea tangerina]|uniref:hypothetical protein n=1 Tax=Umezawaea tangerina TaxID=84725 RepID=UPI0011B1E420|nr:hypothetical protein [Umezawaea tangerina]